MARSNSPGYPNLSLPKAITAARKIFEADRRNPIDRVTAAKHIGYGGQSGASDKALASLSHYGLTERTGKGELRISQLALEILHPDPSTPGVAASHLLEAGLKPAVFKSLYDRFGTRVSEGALRSFLIRENFQNIAINPIMNAYYETCRYLEHHEAFESGGIGGETETDELADQPSEPEMTTAQSQPASPRVAPVSTPVAPPATADLPLNKIRMNVDGARVHLEALLDRRGLASLRKKIDSLEALLEDEDEGEEDYDDLLQ